jgi:hypothetical protein
MDFLEDIQISNNSEHTFGKDDISLHGLISDMDAPKQLFAESMDKPKLEPSDTEQDGQLSDAEKKRKAKHASKFIVGAFDSAFCTVAGLFSLDEDKDQFRADKDEKDDLIDALSEYLKDKGGDIPPGIMVLILAVVIYGGKIPQVVQLRKANLRIKELETEQVELMRKIELQKIKDENGYSEPDKTNTGAQN